MYKVIIVDDEKQIVDGLCKMIKWPELGFEVCATARNGMEAIPLIKSHKAHLVLTDVRMPVMDGLQMLEHVRKNISEDIEFIILSGFSEFRYAQKALQHNVRNYVLKPIDEAEMYGTLIDVKNILDEKEIRNNLKIKSYINNFITGEESDTAGEFILKEEEDYGLRYIAVERHVEAGSLILPAEDKSCCDLLSCMEEKIGKANMKFVMRHDKDGCHMVAGRSILGRFGFDARQLAVSLNEYMSKLKSVPTDILVGKKVPSFRNLHESVQSISLCRSKLFYMKTPSIIFFDDVKEEKFCKIYDDKGAVIRIISAFRKNDMEKLKKELSQLIAHFASLQVVPEIVLVHLDGIMASIMQILSERNYDTGEILELYSKYKKLQSGLNLVCLEHLVAEFCFFCNSFSLKCHENESADIVARVVRYIDEHYMEPLKMIDIAERFFVNPAYLGQQFAKKKGCSFNCYLNSLRMEKAKELLANTDRKIYEIALEIGFDDPNYFSSKFFEYTGYTPSDYRSRRHA